VHVDDGSSGKRVFKELAPSRPRHDVEYTDSHTNPRVAAAASQRGGAVNWAIQATRTTSVKVLLEERRKVGKLG